MTSLCYKPSWIIKSSKRKENKPDEQQEKKNQSINISRSTSIYISWSGIKQLERQSETAGKKYIKLKGQKTKGCNM